VWASKSRTLTAKTCAYWNESGRLLRYSAAHDRARWRIRTFSRHYPRGQRPPSVAYYLHRREATRSYLSGSHDKNDRLVIKRWLIRSLVKPGIWGSGLDVLLTGLRDVIRSSEPTAFPVEALEREMRIRGKTLEFTDEEIRELVDTEYGNRSLLGLMILLFPFVDTATNQFHIDHIYPRDAFHARKLQRLGLTPTQVEELQSLKDKCPICNCSKASLTSRKAIKCRAIGYKLPFHPIKRAQITLSVT